MLAVVVDRMLALLPVPHPGVQILEYIEEEEAHLKEDLLAHPLAIYTEASASAGMCKSVMGHKHSDVVIASTLLSQSLHCLLICAEARGVVINRLQNVVITLDKVKMVLRGPNQVGSVWLHSARPCRSHAAWPVLCSLKVRA